MKKQFLLVLAITLVASTNFSYTLPAENPSARPIVDKMIASINAIKACTYTMRGNERIKGISGLRGGDIFTKLNISPFKIYMKMVTDPNKDTEVLYVKGEREGKALVNPGNIPFNVKLAPLNSMLTKDQHHSLLSAGFGMVPRIVGAGMKKADAQGKFEDVFKYVGDVTWSNKACYKVTIEDPTWTIVTVTAQKGENMYSLSQRLLIPEYSITELNGIKNFDEDLSGKTLKVPSSYAKKSTFYIEKATNLPIFQEMQDDKGVFERYEFFNVVINPTFKADEFTEDFSGYDF